MELFLALSTVALLVIGTPLYVVLFALSGALFFLEGIPLLSTVVAFQKLQSQEFISAIPLFTFAGYVLSRSQSPARIIAFTSASFSFLPGATSTVIVLLMALFTSITGASGVSILALGALMFPLLKEATKSEKFSHGLITASGSIGLLFAPSLPVIIYSIVANQNSSGPGAVELDELFLRALVPSFLLIGFFVCYSVFQERRWQKAAPLTLQAATPFEWKKVFSTLLRARWEVPLPLLVYGGIYSGFFTVLEASIVTAAYTFFVAFVVHRELRLKDDFVAVTVASLKLSGGVFIIMASAFVLTNYFVQIQLPDKIFEAVSPYLTNQLSFLLALNLLLLLAGCLLDIFSAILIILPLALPVVERYGIDPYHFAVLFLVNLEIGYLTPPVGLNLFISSYRFKKPITYLYRSTAPFLLLLLGGLLLLTFFPALTTIGASTEDTSWKLTKGQREVQLLPAPSALKLVRSERMDAAQVKVTFSFKAASSQAPDQSAVKQYVALYLDEETEDKSFFLDFSETQPLEVAAAKPGAPLTFALLLPAPSGVETRYTLSVLAKDALGNTSPTAPFISFTLN